jgi:hypothetical protein
MKLCRFLATAAVIGLAFWVCAGQSLSAQEAPAANGVPAHLLVTVEPHKGVEMPVVDKDDVMVFEGRHRDPVIDWVAATGEQGALEIFVLLDDDSSTVLGTQLEDIRKFILAQSDTTKLGVAYMQNGIAKVEQNPTTDHALAAKAIRLPLAYRGANASPYFSLQDLIKRWPASGARREVFMATDGIDPYYLSPDFLDPYLDAAIADAQRAGIVVSAIYTPGVGHFGHSYWRTYWGQLYLSELAEKTGGEAYYVGFVGPPVAFAPYLKDFMNRLDHQYWLTFLAQTPKKAGLQPIKIRTELHNVDLVAATNVYVSPANK